MTLGNGAARQLVPELAGGGVDYAFYAQRYCGITFWYCRKRGDIGRAVMTGSCEWVGEPGAEVVEVGQRGRRRDSSRDITILEAILR